MALKPRVAVSVLLVATFGLGACSSGGGGALALLKGALKSGQGEALPSAGAIPRSELEKAGVPILRLTVPSRGIDTLLVERDRKGDIVTWTTGDGVTFTFKGGVLIETRGLGADLMSSSAPTGAQVADGGQHDRSYFFIGADEEMLRRDYSCTVTVAANESVTIYGVSFATRHMVERCERPEGFITNDYWMQGSTVRKSSQWVSAAIGSVEIERITD